MRYNSRLKILKQILIIFFIIFVISPDLLSQSLINTDFKGSIIDSVTNSEIEFATVQLFHPQTDKMVYAGIADSSGNFFIATVKPSKYKIVVSSLGYKQKNSFIRIPRQRSYKVTITLNKKSETLNEIEVIGEEQGTIVEIDRVVFRPDSLDIINSRTGADLLRKVPGVFVKRTDNTISYEGESNVLTLINGATSNRNTNTISPEEIERVEIIENPGLIYGSQYSTVLNIVLKEPQDGFKINGNLEYYTKNLYNFSYLHLDYKKSKVRVFAELRLKNYLNKNNVDSLYRTIDSGNVLTIQKKHTNKSEVNKQKGVGTSLQYGVDLYPKENRLINFTGNYEVYNYLYDNSKLGNYQSNYDDSYTSEEFSSYDQTNELQNYTFLYNEKFSDKNELSINSNIYLMKKEHNRYQSTIYEYESLPQSNSISDYTTEYRINSYNMRADYSHKFNNNLNLQIGTQLYHRTVDNKYFREPSNMFLEYDDYRIAPYTQIAYNKNKNSVMSGFRTEYFKYNKDNSKWYYLPTLAYMRKMKKHKLNFNLSSLLNYPKYQMLAPFRFYSNDSTSISTGNPNLKAEQVYKTELKYSYKSNNDFFSLSAIYEYQSDIIGQEISIDNNYRVISQVNNLQNGYRLGGKLFVQKTFLNFIMQGFYVESFYQKYNKNNFDGISYRFAFYTEIKLPFDLYIAFDVAMAGKNIHYNSIAYSSPLINELTIGKSILNDYAEISISAMNFFLDEYSKEKIITEHVVEKMYYHYNNKTILFRLNFFFNRGAKLKKQERDLLMEKDAR